MYAPLDLRVLVWNLKADATISQYHSSPPPPFSGLHSGDLCVCLPPLQDCQLSKGQKHTSSSLSSPVAASAAPGKVDIDFGVRHACQGEETILQLFACLGNDVE